MVSRPHGRSDAPTWRVRQTRRHRRRSRRRANSPQRPQPDARRADRQARPRAGALARRPGASRASPKRGSTAFAREGLEAAAFDGRRSAASRASARCSLELVRAPTGGIARALVVGVPNSGKVVRSINGLLRRAAAENRRPRGRDPAAAVVSAVEPRRTDGHAGNAARQRFRLRRRNGSSRYAAPFRANATIPRRSSTRFTAGPCAQRPRAEGSRSAEHSRRARLLAPRRRGRLPQRAASYIASSTTAASDGSHSRLPMTPKQRKARNAYERERRRLHRLHRFENAARERGFTFVGGVDEVGRGPLAGPVVAACVVARKAAVHQRAQRLQSKCARRLRLDDRRIDQSVRARPGRSASRASPRSTG